MSKNVVHKHRGEGWAAGGDVGILRTDVGSDVELKRTSKIPQGKIWRRDRRLLSSP